MRVECKVLRSRPGRKKTLYVCLDHYILPLSQGFLNVTLFTPFHHRLYVGKCESTYILMINTGYLWVMELGVVCVHVCVHILSYSQGKPII